MSPPPGAGCLPALTPGGRAAARGAPGWQRRIGQAAGRRGAIRLARETYRFSRDVREGMDLYLARHPAPAGSTLATERTLTTDHDALEPKDGH